MKWVIILLLLVSPVIAVAENEGAPPVAEPAVAEAPAADAKQDGQGAMEPGRIVDTAKPGDTSEKGGAPRGDKDDSSGVRFQSIDDLNKLGR
jgi:hypothetical protein